MLAMHEEVWMGGGCPISGGVCAAGCLMVRLRGREVGRGVSEGGRSGTRICLELGVG